MAVFDVKMRQILFLPGFTQPYAVSIADKN